MSTQFVKKIKCAVYYGSYIPTGIKLSYVDFHLNFANMSQWCLQKHLKCVYMHILFCMKIHQMRVWNNDKGFAAWPIIDIIYRWNKI